MRALIVVGTLMLGVGLGAPIAGAAPVPYTDQAVTGGIGLCDPSGKPVSSGSIDDKPFVWRAVSSVPAPAPYNGATRKATLLAYQPRPDVPAEKWNGDTLTATSSYTNPAAPMAQATAIDFTLKDYLDEYPALVDGLIQLRMHLSAAGTGTQNSSYPATDIKITGRTWTVVRGASVPCNQGQAESSETTPGAKTATFPPRHPVIQGASGPASPARPSPVATPGTHAGVSPGVRNATRSGDPASSVVKAPNADQVAMARDTGGGGGNPWAVPAVLLVAAALAGGIVFVGYRVHRVRRGRGGTS